MFQLILTLHILFSIWLMAHLISSAFWKKRADSSGNWTTIATGARALVRSDYTFMAPGVVGLLATGITLGGLTGWDRFQEPWLAVSFLLTIVIVVLWLGLLFPLQRRMSRFAAATSDGLDHADDYQRSSKTWHVVGGVVTLIPLVVLILMVFKPA